MDKESFLRSFFKGLGDGGVDYFVIGEYSHLPYDTGDSDIDIIVNTTMSYVNKIIIESSDTYNVCIASYHYSPYAFHYQLQTDSWGVQIDIMIGGLRYKGIEYYPFSCLVDGVIKYNDINVLYNRKGFYVNFFKEIIYHGKAKEKYIDGFIEEILLDEEKYKKEIISLFGQDAFNVIYSNLSKEGIIDNGKRLRRLIRRNILKDHHIAFFLENVKLLGRLLQKRPGYMIAIEGTDGAGKSAIISRITPLLNEGFHNRIVYKHLRPALLPQISVLLGGSSDDAGRVCNNPHDGNISGIFGSCIRFFYYLIDYVIGYIITIWPKILINPYIFIFDRYYYDYYIDQKRLAVSLPGWFVKICETIVPKPDLVICLGGNPNTIYRRKPETSFEEVKRQVCELKSFCGSRKNTVWVDTTCDINQTVTTTMSAIVAMMNKRGFSDCLK